MSSEPLLSKSIPHKDFDNKRCDKNFTIRCDSTPDIITPNSSLTIHDLMLVNHPSIRVIFIS